MGVGHNVLLLQLCQNDSRCAQTADVDRTHYECHTDSTIVSHALKMHKYWLALLFFYFFFWRTGKIYDLVEFSKEKQARLLPVSKNRFLILKNGFLLEWSFRCRLPPVGELSVQAAQAGARPPLLSMWGQTSWPVPLPSSHSPSCSD